MNKDIFKKRIRKIVEASCGKSRVREMDYEQEDEDPAELARFDALNNNKDETLYRDNPIYREAYDEMTMRESKRRIRRIVQEANMDGTISDDEDFLEDQLLEYVEIEIDELIQFIEIESEKIGGDFRAPAIRQRAISLVKGKLNRSSRK